MAASPAASSCAACSKVAPRPTFICVKCGEGVNVDGEPQIIHYCSSLCRDRDQEAHNSDCEKANRRKQVYRAGTILQDTLTRYRHLYYDMKIVRVEKRGGVIYMYDSDYKKEDPIFFTPPITSPSPQLSPEDIRAVLMYCACTDTARCFHKLSKKLLSDVALQVEEVLVRVNISFCNTKRCFVNGKVAPDYTDHEVLAVETIDGDTFIIDATGSQFGQHRAVLTLQAFIKAYQDPKIIVVRPHGHAHSRSRSGLVRHSKVPTNDVRGAIVQTYLAQVFNKAIDLWESKMNISVGELLRKSCKLYTKKRNDMLDLAFDAMNSANLAREKDFGNRPSSIEFAFSKIERTQPMPEITSLALRRKPEGSAVHQRWVAQRIEEGRVSHPQDWVAMKPVLDSGGTVVIPCLDDDGPDELPDLRKLIQLAKSMGIKPDFS